MKSAKFELYRDKAKKWRWRLVASNGRIVADSGQGYRSKGACVDAQYHLGDLVHEAYGRES